MTKAGTGAGTPFADVVSNFLMCRVLRECHELIGHELGRDDVRECPALGVANAVVDKTITSYVDETYRTSLPPLPLQLGNPKRQL